MQFKKEAEDLVLVGQDSWEEEERYRVREQGADVAPWKSAPRHVQGSGFTPQDCKETEQAGLCCTTGLILGLWEKEVETIKFLKGFVRLSHNRAVSESRG